MLVVAAVISGLNERMRRQQRQARRSAFTTDALYQLNVALSTASQPRQLALLAIRQLDRLFDARTVVFLRSAEGCLELTTELSREERELAARAWDSGEFATGRRDSGFAVWLAVSGIHERLGVIGLAVVDPFDAGSEPGLLLTACAKELATALERVQLANAVRRAHFEAETERMRSSLLSAVSHDLKTPLANMIAAATTLVAHGKKLGEGASGELLSSIVEEGERLSRLINNLLSITRLESPTIELRCSAEDIEEILAAVLDRLRPALGGRSVNLDIEPDLPCVLVEPALIQQVLANLMENAIRYSPRATPIGVSAGAADGTVTVRVEDRGPGVALEEREKVFEKFYRGSHGAKNDGGVGLGLTICRAIVVAHGGKIALRDRTGGGAVAEFTLPVAPSPALDLTSTSMQADS